MTANWKLGMVTVLALLATIALFFFPAQFGSFMATHGPVTAFRSQSLIVLPLLWVAIALLLSAGAHVTPSVALVFESFKFHPESGRVAFPRNTNLRC